MASDHPPPQGIPHSKTHQQKPNKTGTWSPAEDARLREAVAKLGTRWVSVAAEVGTRNGDQCAKRWNENLNPELDHRPWTPEEEERLLNLVDVYGHNWKFMANSFLEARAPLALKNRYYLLMRRQKRQESRQQQQAANADGTRQSRHSTRSRPTSGSASPVPTSAIDIPSYYGGDGRRPQSHHTEYAATHAAASNFSLSTVPFGAGMVSAGDATATTAPHGVGGGVGCTLPRTVTLPPVTTGWDDQDLIWQQHPFLGGGMDNSGESAVDSMAMMPDTNNTGSRSSYGYEGGGWPPSAAPSDGGDSGSAAASAVEYSVTCQRGKVKTLVNHLMDAAMSDGAGRTAEDEQVTVTLRVKT